MENLNKTQEIVIIALLTCLQVILARFAGIKTPIVHISFGFVPLVLTAMLFGYAPAIISASIADILGAILFPVGGAFFPGFTLSAALTGFIYALFLYKKPKELWRVIIAMSVVSIFISLILNTFWIYVISGKAFIILLPPRIMQNVIMIPIKVIVTWNVLYRIIPYVERMHPQTRKAN